MCMLPKYSSLHFRYTCIKNLIRHIDSHRAKRSREWQYRRLYSLSKQWRELDKVDWELSSWETSVSRKKGNVSHSKEVHSLNKLIEFSHSFLLQTWFLTSYIHCRVSWQLYILCSSFGRHSQVNLTPVPPPTILYSILKWSVWGFYVWKLGRLSDFTDISISHFMSVWITRSWEITFNIICRSALYRPRSSCY